MKLNNAINNSHPQVLDSGEVPIKKKSVFRRILPLIIFLLIILIIVIIFYHYNYVPRAVGRIETIRYNIGSKRNASINNIQVQCGERVTKGQLLVTLDTAELDAKLKEVEFQLSAANATIASTKSKLEFEQDNLNLKLEDSLIYRRIAVSNSLTDLNEIKGILYSTEAKLKGVNIEVNRYKKLAERNAIRGQLLDKTIAEKNALEKLVTFYKEALNSESTLYTDASHRYKAYDIKNIKIPIETMIQPTILNVQIEKARVKEVKIKIQESKLTTPTEGIITTINKRENSSIAPSDTILTLVSSQNRKVTAYIKEKWAGSLKIGGNVKLFPINTSHCPIQGKIIGITPVISKIPQTFTPSQNIKSFGIQFFIKLDKPWSGAIGSNFNITF